LPTGAVIQELFPTFVRGLPEGEVEVLAAAAERRSLVPGERVLVHGDVASDLLVVFEGTLAVSVPPDVHLGDKGRGTWVGDLGFVRPGPSSADVTAVESTELFALPQAALARLRTHPRVVGRLWSALARDLASRLRQCVKVCACMREHHAHTLREALAVLHGIPPVHEPISWVPSTIPSPPHGRVDVEDARARLVRALAGVEVFEPLDRKFLALLARAAVFDAYEPGETIMEEGADRDRLYMILGGRVTVSMPKRLAECGAERQLHAGEMLGQLSFVDGGPRTATVVAAEPTLLAAWYPAMIEEFLRLGADGGVAAVHFLHWVTRQIAQDIERVGALLKEAHAWSR